MTALETDEALASQGQAGRVLPWLTVTAGLDTVIGGPHRRVRRSEPRTGSDAPLPARARRPQAAFAVPRVGVPPGQLSVPVIAAPIHPEDTPSADGTAPGLMGRPARTDGTVFRTVGRGISRRWDARPASMGQAGSWHGGYAGPPVPEPVRQAVARPCDQPHTSSDRRACRADRGSRKGARTGARIRSLPEHLADDPIHKLLLRGATRWLVLPSLPTTPTPSSKKHVVSSIIGLPAQDLDQQRSGKQRSRHPGGPPSLGRGHYGALRTRRRATRR